MINKKVYVLPDEQYYLFSSTCPRCGGELTPGVYYKACKGNTSVKVDRSRMTKIYTTQYHNIRKEIGGICKGCLIVENKKSLRLYLILSTVAAVVAYVGLIRLIPILNNSDPVESTSCLPILFLAALLGGGYCLLKILPYVFDCLWLVEYVNRPDEEMYGYKISAHLVRGLGIQGLTKCGTGEVLLSSGAVDKMLKQAT